MVEIFKNLDNLFPKHSNNVTDYVADENQAMMEDSIDGEGEIEGDKKRKTMNAGGKTMQLQNEWEEAYGELRQQSNEENHFLSAGPSKQACQGQ